MYFTVHSQSQNVIRKYVKDILRSPDQFLVVNTNCVNLKSSQCSFHL